jgi:hypothetical protein
MGETNINNKVFGSTAGIKQGTKNRLRGFGRIRQKKVIKR